MTSAEDFILSHSAMLVHEYDPQKRREYYLRTRQLKGRKPGAGNVPTGGGSNGGKQLAPARKPPKQRAVMLQALRVKLARLEETLDNLEEKIRAAKIRAGIDPEEASSHKKGPAKSGGSDGGGSKKDKKPSTAKERREARERYEKNKKDAPAREQLLKKIEAAEERVADARAKLALAREKIGERSPKEGTRLQRPSSTTNPKTKLAPARR